MARFDLTDFEWSVIEPLLPNKPHGVPRVDDRRVLIRKWRLKHRAVADSLEEAGDALFTFTHLPPSQWKSARTTDEMDKLFLT